MKGCTKCHGHLVHPFLIGFLLKGCTKCHGHLVHPFYIVLLAPDIWYTLTFGTPWQVVQYHLVHPDISYTLLPVRKGCTKCHGHLVHPFSKKPIRKGCTKCHGHLVHPFSKKPIRKGCTKCPWHLVHPFSNTPTGKGVPNVWVYQMSGCTKCLGVPNVRVYQMSGAKRLHGKGVPNVHDIWYTLSVRNL